MCHITFFNIILIKLNIYNKMQSFSHLISKNYSPQTGYFHQSTVNLHYFNQPTHSKLSRYANEHHFVIVCS